MIKILNIENTEIKDILTRDINLETGVEDIVSGVIENVKQNGDKALFEYCEKFDGAKLSCLEVSKEEIDAAYEKEDKDVPTGKKNLAKYEDAKVVVTAYAVQKAGFEGKDAAEIWNATFGK